jgi:hypothetical protein
MQPPNSLSYRGLSNRRRRGSRFPAVARKHVVMPAEGASRSEPQDTYAPFWGNAMQ